MSLKLIVLTTIKNLLLFIRVKLIMQLLLEITRLCVRAKVASLNFEIPELSSTFFCILYPSTRIQTNVADSCLRLHV